MQTRELEHLKKLARRYKSKSLPVIDQTIACKNGYSMVTDLESWIIIKALLWEPGVYNIVGQKIDDIVEYPLPKIEPPAVTPLTYIPPDFPLDKYIPFVSKDELKPVMGAVYFAEKDVVASDAHALIAEKHNIRVKRPFLLPAKYAKELSYLLKLYKEGFEIFSDQKYLICENMHFKAIIRETEGIFPNYKGIMPDKGDYGLKVTFPIKDILSRWRDAKAAKIVTALAFDTENKKCYIYDIGDELQQLAQFDLKVEAKAPKSYTMLIMPKLITGESYPGVGIEFLDRCNIDYLYLHSMDPRSRAFIA